MADQVGVVVSRALLTQLIEHSSDAILCLSGDAEILDLNPMAAKIYGWDRGEAVGQEYFSFCQMTRVEPVAHNISEMRNFRVGHKPDQVLESKEGVKHHISWSISRIAHNESPSLILLVGQDVSREKLLEQQRDAAEIYLDHIVSQVPEYVFWKDTNSVYLGCNDLLAKIAGLRSRREIVGKTDDDFGWDPERVRRLRAIDQDVIAQGMPSVVEEVITLPSSGAKRTMVTHKVPLKDNSGVVIGVLGVSVDITDRKLAEEALTEAKEKAEEANKAKIEFMQNMEHDLPTPSAGIAQMIGFLEKKEADSEKRELLHQVGKAAKQLLIVGHGN